MRRTLDIIAITSIVGFLLGWISASAWVETHAEGPGSRVENESVPQEATKILVAKKDLSRYKAFRDRPGELFTEKECALADLPKDALTAADLPKMKGAILNRDLGKGHCVTLDDLMLASNPLNYRKNNCAVEIRANNGHFGTHLVQNWPGWHVDIILIEHRKGEEEVRALMLVEDAVVLAVDVVDGNDGNTIIPEFDVIVAVDREDATRLIQAMKVGSLRISLRPPDSEREWEKVTFKDLMDLMKPRKGEVETTQVVDTKPKVKLLVTKKNLEMHMPFRDKPEEFFMEKEFPLDDAPKDALTLDDLPKLKGKFLKRGLRKGDHITMHDVMGAQSSGLFTPELAGIRAVSIKVNAVQAGVDLASLDGSRVDIIWEGPGQDGKDVVSKVLLERAIVLSASCRWGDDRNVIVVGAMPDDVLVLIAAMETGTLWVRVRESEHHTVTMLVAKKDLAMDTALSNKPEEFFIEKEFELADVPQGVLSAADWAKLRGMWLTRELKKGSLVTAEDLTYHPAPLPDGMRAVAIKIDSDKLGGGCVSGSRVDITWTRSATDENAIVSKVLLENVLVLTVDIGCRRPPAENFNGVVVAVTPDDSLKLILAMDCGTLTLLPHQPAKQVPQSQAGAAK